MWFSLRKFKICFILLSAVLSTVLQGAEWVAEPAINIRTQYNDNVRAYAVNVDPQSSTAYTLVPIIKLLAQEQSKWNMAIDAKAKISRYQDVKGVNSENLFAAFNGGYQTERSSWNLNSSFEKNSLFDTDYNTENADSNPIGLDNLTERVSNNFSPSVSWRMGEASQLSFSVNTSEVVYKKVTNFRYKDYDYDSMQLMTKWGVSTNQQLGFTSSFSKYNSPKSRYSYNQSIVQFDYTYAINQTSNVSVSFGGRRLNSLLLDGQVVACETAGEFEAIGGCLFSAPIFTDVETQVDGSVLDFSYISQTENTNHSFKVGRTVQPSSYGGAQEILTSNYQFSRKHTQRFSSKLLLDASDKTTISGAISPYDRYRYRIEPSIAYMLNRNWKIEFLYRYISQKYAVSDENSVSNAVFLNLSLRWPKLVTTY